MTRRILRRVSKTWSIQLLDHPDSCHDVLLLHPPGSGLLRLEDSKDSEVPPALEQKIEVGEPIKQNQ